MGKKQRKQQAEELKAAAAEPTYSYGSSAPAIGKKKRRLKLSRKQVQRKERGREKGEALADRRGKKQERDARKLDFKIAAKSLW